MTKKLASTFLTIGLMSLILASPLSAQQDTENADPMQLARGAKAWAENCARCHNLRSPSDLDDEEWHVSVIHMRIRANLPKATADDIMAFLHASNRDQK